MRRVFISAGEVSGDYHAASLVKTLREYIPGLSFWGIGMDKLREAKVDIVASMKDYDIVGLDGILRKGHRLTQLASKIVSNIDSTQLAVFVDYPGYNILLARHFKKRGINTVYYIAPQVWGWWRFRAKLVKRYFDIVMVIYPFEVDFWKSVGVNAIYVGNPVYDSIFKENIKPLSGIPEGKKIIGLLPGSRYNEVKRMLPYMLNIKKILQKKHKNLHFILSLVPEGIVVNDEDNLWVVKGNGKSVMKSSDVLLVTSGTATLEGALLEKPMVVLYELSTLSYLIGNMLKRVDYLSLVNIVSNREVVKEFIQKIDVFEVACEVERLLFDKDKINMIKSEYRSIKSILSGNATENAAKLIKRRFFNEKDD